VEGSHCKVGTFHVFVGIPCPLPAKYGIPFDICMSERTKQKDMKTEKEYESPAVEIVEMETGGSVLMTSLTGENINEWEEM